MSGSRLSSRGFAPAPDLMDLNRVGTDGILKQSLERVSALPEDGKKFLIQVVDRLCIALVLEQQFTPEKRFSTP